MLLQCQYELGRYRSIVVQKHRLQRPLPPPDCRVEGRLFGTSFHNAHGIIVQTLVLYVAFSDGLLLFIQQNNEYYYPYVQFFE